MLAADHIFVFVVCGSQEHIETLHYSLQALKRFSTRPIIVVTDPVRNEIPVVHDHVVSVAAPPQYDHHQASIYIKTGLHKFLPKGALYCYLDTDVVALDTDIDLIFEQYKAPITFAKDHCVMDRFSPSAIRCDCAREFAVWQKELKALFSQYKVLSGIPEDLGKKALLLKTFEDIKKNKVSYAWITFRFWAARHTFRLNDDMFYDKKEHYWHDKNGGPILYDAHFAIDAIEKQTPYRCDRTQANVWTVDGKDIFDCRCDHLQEQIQKTFTIDVKDQEWQHWNGGVFLFDDSSHDFLDAWHEKTLFIFTQAEWKTRDQGTLIATAWEFGLSHHSLLPSAFNLIADYHSLHQKHLGELRFGTQGDKDEIIEPHFIHVYHHWADKKWDVWQALEARTGIVARAETDTINALWIGTELSALELLTIKSFIAHGHTFRLWAYDRITTPLSDSILIADASIIIPRDLVFAYKNKNKYGHGQGSYAGFSDIFRYKLLYEEGGWWVDMDVTCLKPFNMSAPYFFRSHHEMPVVGNVMKCPPHSELMKRCYEEAITSVDEDNTDWHRPIEILNRNISELHLSQYIKHDVSNQDQWDMTSRFVMCDVTLPADWYFIHWQNEEWRSKHISRTNFYYKSTLAKLLTKYALYTAPSSWIGRLKNTLMHFSYFQ